LPASKYTKGNYIGRYMNPQTSSGVNLYSALNKNTHNKVVYFYRSGKRVFVNQNAPNSWAQTT